ncbi:hypothetical protein A9513_032885 [Pseudomonas sp. AU12215]|nr:hypothetical protein A9513_032885 [Pseudomonas sp. AU12215]
MAGFGDLVDEMDDTILEVLGDGEFALVDRNGHVQVDVLHGIVEEGVERVVSGAVDRFRTIEVSKSQLGSYDRRGGFMDTEGNRWTIDGIHLDDGHLITFYVVPE